MENFFLPSSQRGSLKLWGKVSLKLGRKERKREKGETEAASGDGKGRSELLCQIRKGGRNGKGPNRASKQARWWSLSFLLGLLRQRTGENLPLAIREEKDVCVEARRRRRMHR